MLGEEYKLPILLQDTIFERIFHTELMMLKLSLVCVKKTCVPLSANFILMLHNL
jgi:hypothetical protein